MRWFKVKKVVDEREELEMLRIEHCMFWFAFWALLVSIFVQLLVFGAHFLQIAGEWTVFMLMAVGTVFLELKGGYFDYFSRPGFRSYLIYSVAAAAAVMGLTFVRGMLSGYYDTPSRAVTVLLGTGIFAGVITFGCLALAGEIVKRRRKKLEEEYDE